MNRNIIFAALCILVWLQACKSPAVEQAAGTTEAELVFSDSLLNMIKLDTVKLLPVENVLKLSGKVSFNSEKVADVYPLFGGKAVAVYAELGDYVKKGQVLARLRSGEVADYQKNLAEAQAQLQIAEKAWEVAMDMNKSGLLSAPELLAAENEHKMAQAELKRLNELFSIYNIGNDSEYTVTAPVSGFVVDKNISRDMQIRPDREEAIFTLSGLDEVWVLANVYESDIARIKEGDTVVVTTLAYPDEQINGRVDKIYNVLNPETKTMSVKIVLQNLAYRLKPGMFANVQLYYAEKGQKQLPTVDTEALIFDSGNHYVIVPDGNKRFEVRKVSVGSVFRNKRTYILSGLSGGEQVVNHLPLLIYNALTSQ